MLPFEMPHIVRAPSRELKRLAVRMEWAFVAFGRTLGVVPLNSKWEALRYAWTLTNLTVRHAEATTLMARTDVAHAPTAWITARAAVESAARTLWLLEPSIEWEREARWLAFLKEGERLGQQERVKWLDIVVARSEGVGAFAREVEERLPEGIEVPQRTPTTHQMLADLDPGLDAFYAIASQFTHGAEFATGMFRSNLGTEAKYGEGSSEGDWIVPIYHAWHAFRTSTLRLMATSGVPESRSMVMANVQVDLGFDLFTDSLDLPRVGSL